LALASAFFCVILLDLLDSAQTSKSIVVAKGIRIQFNVILPLCFTTKRSPAMGDKFVE